MLLVQLVLSPHRDLMKSVGGFTMCQLDPLVTNPLYDLVKSIREFMIYRLTDVLLNKLIKSSKLLGP